MKITQVCFAPALLYAEKFRALQQRFARLLHAIISLSELIEVTERLPHICFNNATEHKAKPGSFIGF